MDGLRKDFVNDDITLTQDPRGLAFGTDALLLAGYLRGGFANGAELGAGTGIVSLLALTRGKVKRVTCYEVQEHFAKIAEKNAADNGLSDKTEVVCTDVRTLAATANCDAVFANPPYMTDASGKPNPNDYRNIARHEVFGGIFDFCEAAKKLLKYGGSFFVVFRPDRIVSLMAALEKNGLAVKRVTFVHADAASSPSSVLIEAKAGGKEGAYLTPPLILYTNKTHKEYTAEMQSILDTGSFPVQYIKP